MKLETKKEIIEYLENSIKVYERLKNKVKDTDDKEYLKSIRISISTLEHEIKMIKDFH